MAKKHDLPLCAPVLPGRELHGDAAAPQRQFLMRPDDQINESFEYCVRQRRRRSGENRAAATVAVSNYHRTVILNLHGRTDRAPHKPPKSVLTTAAAVPGYVKASKTVTGGATKFKPLSTLRQSSDTEPTEHGGNRDGAGRPQSTRPPASPLTPTLGPDPREIKLGEQSENQPGDGPPPSFKG